MNVTDMIITNWWILNFLNSNNKLFGTFVSRTNILQLCIYIRSNHKAHKQKKKKSESCNSFEECCH